MSKSENIRVNPKFFYFNKKNNDKKTKEIRSGGSGV